MAYHYNPETKKAGYCSTTPDKCPLQRNSDEPIRHFDSKGAADNYALERNTQEHGLVSTKRRGSRLRDPLSVLSDKGMTVTQVSSVADHTFSAAPEGISTVDVLTEKPDADFIKRVRAGEVAF